MLAYPKTSVAEKGTEIVMQPISRMAPNGSSADEQKSVVDNEQKELEAAKSKCRAIVRYSGKYCGYSHVSIEILHDPARDANRRLRYRRSYYVDVRNVKGNKYFSCVAGLCASEASQHHRSLESFTTTGTNRCNIWIGVHRDIFIVDGLNFAKVENEIRRMFPEKHPHQKDPENPKNPECQLEIIYFPVPAKPGFFFKVKEKSGDIVEEKSGDIVEEKSGDIVEEKSGDIVEENSGDIHEGVILSTKGVKWALCGSQDRGKDLVHSCSTAVNNILVEGELDFAFSCGRFFWALVAFVVGMAVGLVPGWSIAFGADYDLDRIIDHLHDDLMYGLIGLAVAFVPVIIFIYFNGLGLDDGCGSRCCRKSTIIRPRSVWARLDSEARREKNCCASKGSEVKVFSGAGGDRVWGTHVGFLSPLSLNGVERHNHSQEGNGEADEHFSGVERYNCPLPEDRTDGNTLWQDQSGDSKKNTFEMHVCSSKPSVRESKLSARESKPPVCASV